uniref:Thioredoxin domain-containing protein n=1 Tax=Globodera pallida TaxID=36090 RepID=A0A183CC24_GLOPA
MKRDVNEKSSSSHFDEGNRRGSSHNFEKHSSSESRPAPYSDSPKPVEYFRGPTIKDVPPANGSIGGTVTTWEWGTPWCTPCQFVAAAYLKVDKTRSGPTPSEPTPSGQLRLGANSV